MKKILISVVVAAIGLGKALYDFKVNPAINYAGVFIVLAGILIWAAGRVSLGRFFTINLGLVSSHKLVKKGIYKHIRHPIYLGLFLMAVGVPTTLSNLSTGALMAAMVLPLMIHDIITEESFLAKKFKNYKNYCRETKRIIPLVW